MDEKSKIEVLMREFNLNSAQFAEEVGIKNSTLSHILNDRNKPSLDVLKKILGRFQQINPEWLILDNGKMFRPILNSQDPTLFDSIDLNISKSDIYNDKIQDNSESNKQVKEIIQDKVVSTSEISNQKIENVEKIIEKVYIPQIEYKHKNISRIIIYYDDNTFEEFGSKVHTD
jgi:transcriptional regulator with XRE-family HTH domain